MRGEPAVMATKLCVYVHMWKLKDRVSHHLVHFLNSHGRAQETGNDTEAKEQQGCAHIAMDRMRELHSKREREKPPVGNFSLTLACELAQ